MRPWTSVDALGLCFPLSRVINGLYGAKTGRLSRGSLCFSSLTAKTGVRFPMGAPIKSSTYWNYWCRRRLVRKKCEKRRHQTASLKGEQSETVGSASELPTGGCEAAPHVDPASTQFRHRLSALIGTLGPRSTAWPKGKVELPDRPSPPRNLPILYPLTLRIYSLLYIMSAR